MSVSDKLLMKSLRDPSKHPLSQQCFGKWANEKPGILFFWVSNTRSLHGNRKTCEAWETYNCVLMSFPPPTLKCILNNPRRAKRPPSDKFPLKIRVDINFKHGVAWWCPRWRWEDFVAQGSFVDTIAFSFKNF